MESTKKNNIIVFLKSELSSLSSTIVDFGTFTIFTVWLHQNIAISTASGIILGGVVNFLMNRHFAFKATDGKQSRQVFRYLLVWTGSLVLNTLGTYLFYNTLHINKFVSRACVGLIVRFAFNFPLLKYFVFKK